MSDTSAPAEAQADRAFTPDTATPAVLPWWRVFYWSVRRELWENPAIFLAPLAMEAVVLVPFVFSTWRLPHALRTIQAGDAKHAEQLWAAPSAAAMAALVMGLFVAVLYSLNTLHNERRDRSLLFWKSLPVSDRTAVLAKAFVAVAVTPAAIVAIAIATQALMLAWSTLVTVASGLSPQLLWSHQDMGMMWTVLPYGLFVNALWTAPVFALFLLISVWAPRGPVLWALGLLAAPPLIERVSLNSTHVWQFESERLFGGFAEAFSVGGLAKVPLRTLADLDPARTFGRPDLWIGLVFAGLFLAAAVWLRHRREPV
jgi:ABC-2 type transport system permease protein